MKKKNYIQPEVKTVKIAIMNILSGSGPHTMEVDVNENDQVYMEEGE